MQINLTFDYLCVSLWTKNTMLMEFEIYDLSFYHCT